MIAVGASSRPPISYGLMNSTVVAGYTSTGGETTESPPTPSETIISSFINSTYAEISIRVNSQLGEDGDTFSPEAGAIAGYGDDLAYEMVNVDKAHNWQESLYISNPGSGVTVAIVDTGVHAHEDLMYQPDGVTLREMYYIDINWYRYWVWDWYPFSGHYVYVYQATNKYINTVAEWTSYSDYENNPEMKVGVYDGWDHGTITTGAFLRMAPYANLIIVDVQDTSDWKKFAYQWSLGLLHSWHDPDIVSCSWGFKNGWSNLEAKVNDLVADGTTVFLAASHNYDYNHPYYPARYSNVMAIGAVNTRDEPEEGERWEYSNYGPELDVVAPGAPVYTTSQYDLNGDSDLNDFDHYWGTSLACPIAAGEAALIYQTYSFLYSNDPQASLVKSLIKYHCDPGGQDTNPNDLSPTYSRQNDYYGYGIVDAYEALVYVLAS